MGKQKGCEKARRKGGTKLRVRHHVKAVGTPIFHAVETITPVFEKRMDPKVKAWQDEMTRKGQHLLIAKQRAAAEITRLKNLRAEREAKKQAWMEEVRQHQILAKQPVVQAVKAEKAMVRESIMKQAAQALQETGSIPENLQKIMDRLKIQIA